MSSHKSIKRKRETFYRQRLHDVLVSKREPCRNCGERDISGHYVPPSFGEEGFYSCQAKQAEGGK